MTDLELMGDFRGTEKSRLLFSKSSSLSYCSLRHDIYTVLRYRPVNKSPATRLQQFSYVMELSILSLIFVNVVLAIADTSATKRSENSCLLHLRFMDTVLIASTAAILSNGYRMFLLVSTTIFTLDYFLRVWSCVEDKRYHNTLLGRSFNVARTIAICVIVL